MSSGFGGVGVGAGGGVAGVLAADGGVSFGGAAFWHAALVASNSKMQERLIIGCVMAPRYHGPARRGRCVGAGARSGYTRRAVGMLDEPGLDHLLDAGCTACGARQLTFATYVDGMLPIMGGEPVGRLTWVYDGEKFVDGVYEIACAQCKQVLFAADVCPRCHAPGGLARALGTPNSWPVPGACPSCDDEQLRYVAFVPARVSYEGKRANRARTSTELHEDGFHGYRADCRDCGPIAERTDSCPLCAAPAPLRARPG